MPAPFSACHVWHHRCAVVVHTRTPVLSHGMLDNVCRWWEVALGASCICGLVVLLYVHVLVANESMDTECCLLQGCVAIVQSGMGALVCKGGYIGRLYCGGEVQFSTRCKGPE